jgi:hypothetical protein
VPAAASRAPRRQRAARSRAWHSSRAALVRGGAAPACRREHRTTHDSPGHDKPLQPCDSCDRRRRRACTRTRRRSTSPSTGSVAWRRQRRRHGEGKGRRENVG